MPLRIARFALRLRQRRPEAPLARPVRARRRLTATLATAAALAVGGSLAAAPVGAAEDPGVLRVLRADWFTSGGQTFLSFEAKAGVPDGQATLTATWAPGPTGSATLARYEDADVYLYHRTATPIAVDTVPASVTITSSAGGSVTAPVDKWLGDGFELPAGYKTRFLTTTPSPTEANARLEALHAEFPGLTELITLPEKTFGYRRHAQAQFGTGTAATAASTFFVTSRKFGHEGGNDITLQLLAPTPNAQLTVFRNGNDITVFLATDAERQPVSTAAQVVAAINASSASELLTAYTFRRNAGAGVVPAAARQTLTDGLRAPASISREPFTMKVLRVGKVRDGSKAGVFLYAGEHPNEITPVLSVAETAERLLRNYATDEWTRNAIDNLDIFLLPWANPDGGHYSIFDTGVRKNLTNYCAPEDSDPGRRNSFGVNVNRNYATATVFEGWDGASTDCLNGNYAGPKAESEPEVRNLVWMAETFDNIKFAMNTHCCGGYFMWTPGAYIEDGRVSVQRPDAGIEAYYYEASEHILSAVQTYRDTAVWPGRTGPIIDVLYSAAGNSADYFWIEHGILAWAFETNGPRWDAANSRWVNGANTVDVTETAMEYANGQLGIVDVALSFQLDATAPESALQVTSRTATSTTFTVSTSEPATVHYTLDGSRPTLASPKLQAAGLREGAQSLTVTTGTTVNWFAVDPRGNVENGYAPAGTGAGYNSFAVAIGTPVSDLKATVDLYAAAGRLSARTAADLQGRLDRAQSLYTAGSESRTIGYLESFVAKVRNQVRHDDLARDTLVAAAERLIADLQAADAAEGAALPRAS
ncbi:M14 family zinc carboxypeptidase [Motilibacter aurantiacus]|uniref:M14 family zinc carboxypeptidase n=1 Tax=Motilibacter aurantiacus TaxID=2714955 RepID=UPI00140BB5F2|nr:zinc carboxypeptidase [Motilibacter aurantiacus]